MTMTPTRNVVHDDAIASPEDKTDDTTEPEPERASATDLLYNPCRETSMRLHMSSVRVHRTTPFMTPSKSFPSAVFQTFGI